MLVRLLLGEIPDRVEFTAPGMRAPLQPYFELTTAVRSGDLAQFSGITDKYASVFKADKVTNLITRLHHNVIRIGLRRINLAYSRISLKVRLQLDTNPRVMPVGDLYQHYNRSYPHRG